MTYEQAKDELKRIVHIEQATRDPLRAHYAHEIAYQHACRCRRGRRNFSIRQLMQQTPPKVYAFLQQFKDQGVTHVVKFLLRRENRSKVCALLNGELVEIKTEGVAIWNLEDLPLSSSVH